MRGDVGRVGAEAFEAEVVAAGVAWGGVSGVCGSGIGLFVGLEGGR